MKLNCPRIMSMMEKSIELLYISKLKPNASLKGMGFVLAVDMAMACCTQLVC